MAKKKYEFKPDPAGSGTLSKLYLTRKQRQSVLKWALYGLLCLAALILQDFCARFSCKQRYMIFSQIEDMVAHGGDLLERPSAGCQALPQNFTCRIGRAVEVVCAVLDL